MPLEFSLSLTLFSCVLNTHKGNVRISIFCFIIIFLCLILPICIIYVLFYAAPQKYIRHQLKNELSEYLKITKRFWLDGGKQNFVVSSWEFCFISLFYSKERTQNKHIKFLKVELKFYPLFHWRNFMLFVLLMSIGLFLLAFQCCIFIVRMIFLFFCLVLLCFA